MHPRSSKFATSPLDVIENSGPPKKRGTVETGELEIVGIDADDVINVKTDEGLNWWEATKPKFSALLVTGYDITLQGWNTLRDSRVGNWLRNGRSAISTNFTKGLGKAFAGIGLFDTGISAYKDIGKGNYYSASSRVIVAGAPYALGRIPYVGPALKFGIPLWDAFYGEQFHRSVENKYGNGYKK
ncbi:hypothetical protein [Aquimarina agarivorans]|uniref:hypothetical protein n=1 Tax=Aquimarina agarivorans TaxID=980584 RepID=UPI000248EF8D|nr:hypothetical protein [Aquimarina agarivorans]